MSFLCKKVFVMQGHLNYLISLKNQILMNKRKVFSKFWKDRKLYSTMNRRLCEQKKISVEGAFYFYTSLVYLVL